MNEEILRYNESQPEALGVICSKLKAEIERVIPQAVAKIYYGNPVWFIDDNPIVGYNATKKDDISSLFWSGQSFDESELKPVGKYKAAEARYQIREEIDTRSLERWLKKAVTIQWDYKNIRKNSGKLEKIFRNTD